MRWWLRWPKHRRVWVGVISCRRRGHGGPMMKVEVVGILSSDDVILGSTIRVGTIGWTRLNSSPIFLDSSSNFPAACRSSRSLFPPQTQNLFSFYSFSFAPFFLFSVFLDQAPCFLVRRLFLCCSVSFFSPFQISPPFSRSIPRPLSISLLSAALFFLCFVSFVRNLFFSFF